MMQYRVVKFYVIDGKNHNNNFHYHVYDDTRFVAGPFSTKKLADECELKIREEFAKFTAEFKHCLFWQVPKIEDQITLQNQMEGKVLKELKELKERDDLKLRKKLNLYDSPTLH